MTFGPSCASHEALWQNLRRRSSSAVGLDISTLLPQKLSSTKLKSLAESSRDSSLPCPPLNEARFFVLGTWDSVLGTWYLVLFCYPAPAFRHPCTLSFSAYFWG